MDAQNQTNGHTQSYIMFWNEIQSFGSFNLPSLNKTIWGTDYENHIQETHSHYPFRKHDYHEPVEH